MTSSAVLRGKSPSDTRRAKAPPARRFARFPWAVLGYTLLVILFGAVVRVTGSGAGCGQHWPTCHGEIAHLPQRLETAIELSHRITSGLSLFVVLALVFWTRRQVAPGHVARKAAWFSLVFLIVEALIGAGLVLFALVADDTSVARAVVMPAHLVNTSLLMLSLTVTAWAASRPDVRLVFNRSKGTWVALGLVLLVAVSATGALTALGDTLYPVTDGVALSDRLRESQSGATFLERLRSLHPFLALFASLFLFVVAGHFRGERSEGVARRATLVIIVLFLQLVLGVTNIWLSAPGWMQVTHLAVANVLWVAWVLMGLELLAAHADGASESSPLSTG